MIRSSTGRRKKELTIVSVAHTNIPPKEPVVYSKQTQTIQTTHTSHDGESIFLLYLLIYLYCTYVLHLTRDFAKKPLDIRKKHIIFNSQRFYGYKYWWNWNIISFRGFLKSDRLITRCALNIVISCMKKIVNYFRLYFSIIPLIINTHLNIKSQVYPAFTQCVFKSTEISSNYTYFIVLA